VIMSSFSDNFKSLCSARNITQDEFALILGRTRGTISNYQTGRNEPNHEDMVKIADYFNVSIDWLLGRPGAEKSFFIDNQSSEDQLLLEQFMKSSEAVLREKGNLSKEKLEYTLKFMEFTFLQDLEKEKKEGK
jgi:transcriptional regulator with XRE-family HTH domain